MDKKNYAILTDNVINKNNLNKSEKNYYICKQNIQIIDMNKAIKILLTIILTIIALYLMMVVTTAGYLIYKAITA